jgi:hypothetical protein
MSLSLRLFVFDGIKMKNVDNIYFLKHFNPITRTVVNLVTFKNIIDKQLSLIKEI